jgi:hypothetical protein
LFSSNCAAARLMAWTQAIADSQPFY